MLCCPVDKYESSIVGNMAPISLTAEDTQKRFGVSKAIKAFPQNLTEQEEANVKTVLAYMEVRVFNHSQSQNPLTKWFCQ